MYRLHRRWILRIALLTPLAAALYGGAALAPAQADGLSEGGLFAPDHSGKKKGKSAARDARKSSEKEQIIRWGQRRNESNEDYDKRYARTFKRVKRDKKGDWSGGRFFDAKNEEVRMWTHRGTPFICRSDISQEFTTHLVMYMEMLHRDYSELFGRVLGVPARVREPIEVIVFGDRITYIKAGGSADSGGHFNFCPNLVGDRGPFWPAKHFRLVQFTDGITDFGKWPKGVLKHEAAHMELQLRLGFTMLGGEFGFAVLPPIWYTEGVATVCEDWDFNKSVEENLLEIPNRGRYAPFIRRMYGSDAWQDFDYLWHLNMQTWNASAVYYNYCQAWSLTAYMFTGGVQGHRDFRKIMDLTKSVGENSRRLTSNREVVQSKAWDLAFPEEDRAKLQANWYEWIEQNVSQDKRVPDEDYLLRRMGVNPEVVDRIQPFRTEEEQKANREWLDQEEKRREKAKGKRIEW